MTKSQKRGVIFFSVLTCIILAFQVYANVVKSAPFNFKQILEGCFLITFCYVYPQLKIRLEIWIAKIAFKSRKRFD